MQLEKRIIARALSLLLFAAMLASFACVWAGAAEGTGGEPEDVSWLLESGSPLTDGTIKDIKKTGKPSAKDPSVYEVDLKNLIVKLHSDWDNRKSDIEVLKKNEDQFQRLKNFIADFNTEGIPMYGTVLKPDDAKDALYGTGYEDTIAFIKSQIPSEKIDEDKIKKTQAALNDLFDECIEPIEMKDGKKQFSLIICELADDCLTAGDDEQAQLVKYWKNGAALRAQAKRLCDDISIIMDDPAVSFLLRDKYTEYSGRIESGKAKFNTYYANSEDPPAEVNAKAKEAQLEKLAAVVRSGSTEFTATYTKTSGGGSGGSGGGSLTPQVTEKDLVPKVSVAEKGAVRGASVDTEKKQVVLDIQPNGISREQLEKVIASTNAGTKVTYTYDKLSKDGAIATGTLLTVTTTVSGKKLSVTYTLIVAGDTNCDGKSNATDAAQIAYYYAGKVKLDENQIKAADLNQSGEINATDAAMVVSKFASWDRMTYQSKIK